MLPKFNIAETLTLAGSGEVGSLPLYFRRGEHQFMPFVFVSHADADKPKLRHIVGALITAGLKIWLDNPAAMGFTDRQISEHFHHLEAGGRWRDRIEAGLREASVVLVCWSERARENRDVWHAEASVARTLQKLVACRIDDVDPQTLPDDHGAEQIPDLRTDEPAPTSKTYWLKPRVPREKEDVETRLSLLVSAVRAKMGETIRRRFEKRVQNRIQRDVFTPFLIDRADQESILGAGIDQVRSGGVRAFLIAGPENECPDEFMLRLERYTSPKRLNDRAWYQVRVEWPRNYSPSQFGDEFRARLAAQLGLPATSASEEIANIIAYRDRPVAVVSLMRSEEWQVNEPRRIGSWLKWWDRLSRSPIRFSAIPILCVKMPKAKPGWKLCPSGCGPGGTVSNPQIWREIQRLQNTRAIAWPLSMFRRQITGPKVCAPTVLHTIRMGDVDRWLGEHFDMMSIDYSRAKDIIDAIFRQKAPRKNGVALEDFAKVMRPLFEES